MSPETERALVEQAKADPQAFGLLYDHYYVWCIACLEEGQKIVTETVKEFADLVAEIQ